MILRKKDINNITLLFKYKNNIKLIYINGYKRYCYFILANFIINYNKQGFIIGIKINI